jgi:methionyl-tRNA synthetase
MSETRFLITSALPYASGITHLGNVVGSTLPADIYARYCRLRGRDTLYVCGSDEHGVAITIAAEKEGLDPQELVDRYHHANENALRRIGIAFDVFGRTTNPLHAATAREFFNVWMQSGCLIEKEEDQFYDEKASMFLPDRYVEGTCPNCGFDKARGDQCDNCGSYYNQLDLKNPRSVITGASPVVRKTKHWYFRLGLFQEWVEQYIESHADKWKDNVLQQSRSWLKQGLSDRAATRDMQWGIPVPIEGAEGKVLYVWFEAVLGYISATRQWAMERGTPDAWKKWWRDPGTQYTAFLGKDNIVFHSIIFPILLHTRAAENYILPNNIPANEFLNLEGEKFSKSRNWGIDVDQYLNDFSEPQHTDILRYVLTMNMPENRDSDFTWKDFQARSNNELGAILGNFVNRVALFLQKNFNSTVPTVLNTGNAASEELALTTATREGLESAAKHLDAFRFRDAATEAMNIARAANKYFNDKAPWKSVKSNMDDCAQTLYNCVQTIHTLSVVFAPFIPNACASMQRMFGLPITTGDPLQVETGADVWMQAAIGSVPSGSDLLETPILFSRIEDEVVDVQLKKLGVKDSSQASEGRIVGPPVSDDNNLISIEEFAKVKLKTVIITSAERVPKSDKLVRLQVDTGGESRQIVAGIAKHYRPEDLVGKTVVIVSNLKPARLMGLESQGMVLAASNSEGALVLVTPESTEIGPGAIVK